MLDLIAKIVGVLGFIGSVVVFIVTRVERLKQLIIELSCAIMPREPRYLGEIIEPRFLIRVTNPGPKPIITDIQYLRVIVERKTDITSDFDWELFDVHSFPVTLRTGDSFTAGVPLGRFADCLSELNFKKDEINITVQLCDVDKRKFNVEGKYSLSKWALATPNKLAVRKHPKDIWIDQNFPEETGLKQKLQAQGYRISWQSESKIRQLELSGWRQVVYYDKGQAYYPKIKDRPENLILMKHLATPAK